MPNRQSAPSRAAAGFSIPAVLSTFDGDNFTMESRLEKIETKVAFAEDLLEELNRTVVRQQQEIDLLQKQVRALREQLATLLPGPTDAPHDEPPPHY